MAQQQTVNGGFEYNRLNADNKYVQTSASKADHFQTFQLNLHFSCTHLDLTICTAGDTEDMN